MPTALTGSTGWTGLHPVQLGGPPLINSFERKLPPTAPPQVGAESAAKPLIAHVYQNDGVVVIGTLPVLNRPVLSPTLANGGFNQILLSVQTYVTGMIWGQFIWGSQTWGGTGLNISQGNVIRLSEQGGDGSFIYGGVVEDLPETISPSGVSHQILISPFAIELDDTFSQAVYTAPVDVSQLVRDAVALTHHCSCDQVSCPASTGVMAATTGQLDFRNQSVKQIIDTARSIAGPTWFWHVDELGRVWFQAMGSSAIYTIPQAQYEERTKSASIQDRKNMVVAVGGVPTGGSANVSAIANGDSQAAIGIRALNPPLQIPNITDQPSLTLIANNILTVLDRTWQRVNLKVLPSYGRRIHASQPGGAMVRYYEPAINPMRESSGGAGYSGTFIAQNLSNDGLYQQVTAGDIPVTSQNDVQNMVNSLVARAAANSLQVTAAALNLKQTLTGTFQSGTGTVTSTGLPATLWSLNQQEFEAIDPNGIPRAEMGNLGASGRSPAQWGFRASDASGNPIFDSLGLISVMTSLVQQSNGAGNQQIVGAVSGASITGGSATFSIPRQLNVLTFYTGVFSLVPGGANGFGYLNTPMDGVDGGAGNPNHHVMLVGGAAGHDASVQMFNVRVDLLAAGSHTASCTADVDANTTIQIFRTGFWVFQLGS